MNDSPWFVTTDRALYVEETGGCWVELSRLYECEERGQVVEQLDCSFYGPVEFWIDDLSDLTDDQYASATTPV